MCCHSYDICAALVTREAGVLVTGVGGKSLDAPLVVDADVAWVGYANAKIRSVVEPVLCAVMRRHGLLT